MAVAAIVARSGPDGRVAIAKSLYRAGEVSASIIRDRNAQQHVPLMAGAASTGISCPADPAAVGLLLAELEKCITAQTTCDWLNLQDIVTALIANPAPGRAPTKTGLKTVSCNR